MLKKHILSLAALALGFGLVFTQSAFKPANNGRLQYTFHYTGPSGMTKSDVEDVANWSYDADADCPEGEAYACAIRIDDSYVDNEPANPTLNSSANISAALTTSGKAAVVTTANGDILNTQD